MEQTFEFDVCAAMLRLGLVRGGLVEHIATLALKQGLDTYALRILAGGQEYKCGRPEQVLYEALTEAGVQFPEKLDAARTIAKAVSEQIVGDEVDPFEAAKYLMNVSHAAGDTFHELDPFIYSWSEGTDRPKEKEFFRREILAEASLWARRGKGSIE